MSKRASRRTQQIAEEIAALKAKLSALRDDVNGNRLGSRHSSWYQQRYIDSPPSKDTPRPEEQEAQVQEAGQGGRDSGKPRVLSFGDGGMAVD
jgi:hypothetical protein